MITISFQHKEKCKHLGNVPLTQRHSIDAISFTPRSDVIDFLNSSSIYIYIYWYRITLNIHIEYTLNIDWIHIEYRLNNIRFTKVTPFDSSSDCGPSRLQLRFTAWHIGHITHRCLNKSDANPRNIMYILPIYHFILYVYSINKSIYQYVNISICQYINIYIQILNIIYIYNYIHVCIHIHVFSINISYREYTECR